jgi:predicted enzyme related to lactoylglutathione lyase
MSSQPSKNEGIQIVADFDDTAAALTATTVPNPLDLRSGGADAIAANMLNLVVLFSPDLERTAKFYALLGIRFERERHGTGPEHLAARLGSQVLEIYPQTGNGGVSEVRLGFEINSVDAAVNAVRLVGGCVVSAPQRGKWGYRAVLADPDGRRVEIVQSPNGKPS